MATQEMSDILLRLRAMPSSLNDALRTMDEAAARIEALEVALREISLAVREDNSLLAWRLASAALDQDTEK